MFQIIFLPEFWIGAAIGGIVVLLALILLLAVLGLTDEAAELSQTEADYIERISRPRPWPAQQERDLPDASRQRTSRSDMRFPVQPKLRPRRAGTQSGGPGGAS